MDRAKLDVEDLLKILLLLLIVYLALKILEGIIGLALGLLLEPVVIVAILIVVALWYFDYI